MLTTKFSQQGQHVSEQMPGSDAHEAAGAEVGDTLPGVQSHLDLQAVPRRVPGGQCPGREVKQKGWLKGQVPHTASHSPCPQYNIRQPPSWAHSTTGPTGLPREHQGPFIRQRRLCSQKAEEKLDPDRVTLYLNSSP